MKITIPENQAVEIVVFNNESYVLAGTVNRTWTGATDMHFVDERGIFIPDAKVLIDNGAEPTPAALTNTFDFDTTLTLDPKAFLSRNTGQVYYKPVGPRPAC